MTVGSGPSAAAEPAGHITGVGGIFFKAKDPKALVAWYRDVLGLPLQPERPLRVDTRPRRQQD